jgi:multiple sugar transport system permease protein
MEKRVRQLPIPNSGRGMSRGERVALHAALILICVGFVMPFAWMLSTSLKTNTETQALPPSLIPIALEWDNYQQVITHEKIQFPLFTRNTLVIAVLSVIGNTFASALVAYGFARIEFRGRGVLFGLMLGTMMIPFPVTMVSLFAIFRWFGEHGFGQWLGTFKPLWVPAWFGSAFSIFLMRQFFRTIPRELSEAARIDGCSELGIFLRVILPLSKPVLAVVALFTFLHVWNDFLGPLVYLQDQQQYTLALGLQTFQSQHGGTQWHLLMAASVLILLPVIVLFFVAQRMFIQGIATTGMKG